MTKSVMAIAFVVFLSAPVAMAQQRSAGVCVADIKAKCAGVEPGEGRHLVALGEGRVVEHVVDKVAHRARQRHHGLADVHQLGGAGTEHVHASGIHGTSRM